MKNNIFNYIYLKDQKLLIGLIGFAVLMSAGLGYLTPILISDLYESYQDRSSVDAAIMALVILMLAEYFMSILYSFSINKYIQKLVYFIRARSYQGWIESIESSGEGDHVDQKYPMGEVLSRILTDTEAVIEMVSSGSFKIFIDFAFIISCLISFIKLNTVSGMALIIAEVLVCFLLILGSKKMSKVYMAVRKSIGKMSRIIADLAGGFRFTYFHPHYQYASKKGYVHFEDFLKKQLVANIWDASYFSIAESLFPILLALLVFIFPYSNIMEVALIATIVDLIQRSIGPIKEVAGKISSIQRARTGIVRIEEFTTDVEKLPRSYSENALGVIALDKIEVSIKDFSYPKVGDGEPFSLSEINFTASAGELIGLVGQSGCGKSTVLKILSTDILAEDSKINIFTKSGEIIEVGGKNQRELLKYREQVSIVSQDSHLFSASLRFNIAMDEYEGDELTEFWEMVAREIPYIKKWGLKLDDKINPKELSLGQKQLICALRSCYLVKPIVLFDEISSGLDSDLEEALKKLVLLIQKKSLTFIVAHRIETIVNSNKIIVMDNGEVMAQGTHSELLSNSEHYQDFITELNKI